MVRNILLAGTMMIATPVLAQTAPVDPQNEAAPTQTAPATGTALPAPETTVPPADGTPVVPEAAPVPETPQTTPVPETPQAAPTEATDAPDPAPRQVAQVVDQQFSTYDKNGDGILSKPEFSAWMTALKAQAPTGTGETPAQATAWNDAAFRQADGDRSAGVTKTELTGFLVKGASQPS